MFGGFVAAMHKQEENSQSCPYRELFLVSSLPGFPGGLDSKEPACHAGDLASIPGSGSYPGEGNGYPLQGSCPILLVSYYVNSPLVFVHSSLILCRCLVLKDMRLIF